jgi:hypothetical protein
VTVFSKATIRRSLLWLAMAAGAWAALIAATDGFTLSIAGVVITARRPVNPLVGALVALAIAAWMARPRVDATLAGDVTRLRHITPATWLLVFGTGLRLWFWASARPLWLDEQMIALNIRDRGFAELTGALWLGQSAPLGWLWSERLIIAILGLGEASIRALPMAFGVATLFAGWWIGRRWMSALGASALVFLLAIGTWVFHNALELKHYSADTFFGLLLPALVVWALEGSNRSTRLRRAMVWWAVAIAGAWWSMGGLLVAPACALLLIITLWRQDGLRTAALAAAAGVGWLIFFGVHYALSLRFSTGSQFLQTGWADWMAPAGAGPIDRIAWLAAQAAPFAIKPGGTTLPWLFWAVALCGFVMARPRKLGLVCALIPLSAGVLAIFRVVPIFQRVAIWSLPAVYVGIALALDAAWRWTRDAGAPQPTWRRGAAAIVGVAVLVVCADIARLASVEIPVGHAAGSNHNLDDRETMAWVSRQIQPGDVVITTALAKPAVWWYGNVPLAGPAGPTSIKGAPILELTYHDAPCDSEALGQALQGYDNAVIFFGFRFDDVPDHFDALVLQQFHRLGIVNDYTFTGVSKAAVVDLGTPDPRRLSATGGDPELIAPGCLGVKPATRW